MTVNTLEQACLPINTWHANAKLRFVIFIPTF